MLVRHTYHNEKQKEIKVLIKDILENLLEITDLYESYFKNPTNETKQQIINNERYVDKNEKKIEQYILEIFSLEQLTVNEIKWLLAMNRIIRELERCGDYLINVITISDVLDTKVLGPYVMEFIKYEKDMLNWLLVGICEDNIELLEDVIAHDEHINKLNKETFTDVASQINTNKEISESELKMVVIGRFLERLGDHLSNSAKAYIKTLQE